MRLNIQKTDVMIVGAGLSGLMMACQLLRLGVQPIIIDSRDSPSDDSRTIGLQARSMEIFRQMGIAEEINASGVECKGITLHSQLNGQSGSSCSNTYDTPFPLFTIIPQDVIENILINQLTLQACPIYWNTTLINHDPNQTGIKVEVNSEGLISRYCVKWMVGADGLQSKVRQLAGLAFDGKTYKQPFFQADVQLEETRYNDVHLFISSSLSAALFPLSDKGKYRLVGLLPPGHANSGANPKHVMDQIKASSIPVMSYDHIKSDFFCSKIASRFSDQRLFLVGDAAQVHSPFAGLGVNTGIQDAYNLSWKLANVLKGRQDATILQSYEGERRHLVASTLKKADRIFGFAVNSTLVFQRMKNRIINKTLRSIFQHDKARDFLHSWFAQTVIEYRESQLAVHHSGSKMVRAGDRIPYLPVFDERTKTETDLHTWCRKPGFILILMGNIPSNQLLIMGKWLKQKYTHYMHFYYLPFSEKNQLVFDAFEIKKGTHRMILVRPDMHIAFIQDVISANLIDNYMVEVMKWKF